MPEKVEVLKEDILKVIDEVDRVMLWDNKTWIARCRLLKAAGIVEED